MRKAPYIICVVNTHLVLNIPLTELMFSSVVILIKLFRG